jgi:CHAT domain-containing protein
MNPPALVQALLAAKETTARRALLLPRDEAFYVAVVDLLKDESDRERLRDPRAALKIVEVAAEVAEFAGVPRCRAVAAWAKGNVLIHQGDYQECLRLYGEAAHFFAVEGAEIEAARLAANRAWVLKNLGRYEEGIQAAQAALTTLRRYPPSRFLASTLNGLGTLQRLSGRYQDALLTFDEGDQIYTALGDEINQARLRINRANVLRNLDRFEAAIDRLESSRATLARHERALEVARADLNLGIVYTRLGHYDEALTALDRAGEGFTTLDNRMEAAVVELHRADLYAEFNLLDELLQTASHDWRFFEERQMQRHAARTLLHKAIAWRRLGDSVQAEELLDDARAAFARLGDEVWVQLVELERAASWCETGAWAQALPVVIDTIAFLRDREMPLRAAGGSLLVAECLLVLGQPVEAAAYCREVLDLARSRDVPPLLYRAHYGLGRAARQQDHLEDALSHFRQAVEGVEGMRQRLRVEDFRLGFLEDKLRLYHDAVLLCLQLGREKEAFAYVERVKSGALVDLLVATLDRRPATQDVAGEKLVARLAGLRQRLNWQYDKLEGGDEAERGQVWSPSEDEIWQQISTTEKKAVRAWRELQRAAPFYLALEDVDFSTSPAARADLQEGELLLQYCVAGETIHVFVVGPGGLEACVPLSCTPRQVQEATSALDATMRGALTFEQGYVDGILLPLSRQQLGWLYDDLLRPLAPFLQGSRCLLFAPDDVLFEVPFHALHDGDGYLLDHYEVAYTPSAGALRLCRENHRRRTAVRGQALVVGYTEGNLPHVRQEVGAVAGALPGATVLLDAEATLDRLRDQADSSALLHLATHALFRRDNPLFSALRLAGGDWLRVMDLYTLRLNGALVTLSGCETGRHRLLGGDLLGLSRGFFCAGASALVTSLWPVDDVSTAILMKRFYAHLAVGQTAAAALRKAQLTLREQQDGQETQPYAHPFYWASFCLLGTPDVRLVPARPGQLER